MVLSDAELIKNIFGSLSYQDGHQFSRWLPQGPKKYLLPGHNNAILVLLDAALIKNIFECP